MESNNIVLKIKFIAGTEIKEAIEQAIYKALEWDVALIKFKFNGTTIYVSRNSDVDDKYQEYLSLKNTR